MKKRMQASVREIIIDKKLFFLGVIICSESDNVRVLHLPNHIHILLKLAPRAWICVLQPLDGDGGSIIKHRLIHRPQTSFSEHLRRRSQQFLKLKLIPPLEEHKLASLRPATSIAISTSIIRVHLLLASVTTTPAFPLPALTPRYRIRVSPPPSSVAAMSYDERGYYQQCHTTPNHNRYYYAWA